MSGSLYLLGLKPASGEWNPWEAMFQWRTFSDQNIGRKEGDLEVGGGMEDHIQASGGAAGPSQTQVDNDKHPPAFQKPL